MLIVEFTFDLILMIIIGIAALLLRDRLWARSWRQGGPTVQGLQIGIALLALTLAMIFTIVKKIQETRFARQFNGSRHLVHRLAADWCDLQAEREADLRRLWLKRAREWPELGTTCKREAERHASWERSFRKLEALRRARASRFEGIWPVASPLDDQEIDLRQTVREFGLGERSAMHQASADREFFENMRDR